MAEDYASLDMVAEHLLEPALKDSDKYEDILASLLSRASRLIDAWFGYPDGHFKADPAATQRFYDGSGNLELWPDHMAVAPTEVAVAEAGVLTDYIVWASTDYLVGPYNALSLGQPLRFLQIDNINGTKIQWYRYPKAVRITARWGWATETPRIIEEACIVQVARWFKRGQQAFQDAGAVTELMQMRYLKKIDPEVELLLSKMAGGITI